MPEPLEKYDPLGSPDIEDECGLTKEDHQTLETIIIAAENGIIPPDLDSEDLHLRNILAAAIHKTKALEDGYFEETAAFTTGPNSEIENLHEINHPIPAVSGTISIKPRPEILPAVSDEPYQNIELGHPLAPGEVETLTKQLIAKLYLAWNKLGFFQKINLARLFQPYQAYKNFAHGQSTNQEISILLSIFDEYADLPKVQETAFLALKEYIS